jgi:hypothetical protein
MSRIFSECCWKDNRVYYSMTNLWLLYGIGNLDIIRPIHLNVHNIFYLIMTLATAAMWMLFITVRLADFRVNRLWGLLFIIPWVIVLWTLSMGRSYKVGVAITFAFAVQLPLMLLPSRRISESSKRENSEE